ncbi:hypothetical protein F5X68DRAFT_276173 [Plectosphaerella plurivora]|uniref:Uncharacterized protein n=1 Tax=Plectosphaerella plurivora TaxID=936078 RepID=A0A9P8VAS1_9PEZI|nr:hypothetical protein F5X68DRAFT_276173 [Plectosphaerella plurivora]
MSTPSAGERDEFPRSVKEAKEHIRQIRRDKGLGDEVDQIGNNASDLQSALGVLSHDLYQTSTHFLLELIQNADDNSYDTDTPTLSIVYSPGKIKIHCNERGFSKRNLEAICRICKSTKSGRSKTAGFVGEKGIGFKSVFKVASVVWISSGHYSFKFNRDGHLGMIAPIWEEFPDTVRKGGTSICLQLAKDCDEFRIVEELSSYDEKILLFLRRLRRLEISVKPPRLFLSRTIDTVLAREAPFLGENNSNYTVLLRNGERKRFFVWRHTANKMPLETRRPGISSSELILAFPFQGHEGHFNIEPECEDQSVYAFLPIRNCGFPFLLQGDFLLSANREDVQDDSQWNQKLATEAAKAFVGAVQAMGKLSNALRWRWLSYIPTTSSQTFFFEAIRANINKSLQVAPILESEAGYIRVPTKLTYAPSEMRDRDGRPFLDDPNTLKKHVASKYITHGAKWPSLRELGVVEQNSTQFSLDLYAALGDNAASFMSKRSGRWHDDLAKSLVATHLVSDYTNLPVIPTQDGSWVAPAGKRNVFFPSENLKNIPGGIDIHIVDERAVASSVRRKLFEECGVGQLNNVAVRGMIIKAHTGTKPKAADLSPEVLLSHLVFFFDTKDELAKPPVMQVATDTGNVRASDTVYQHSDQPGSASTIPTNKVLSHKYSFLHPIYSRHGSTPARRTEFQAYIREHLSVEIYPRLTPLKTSTIHPDFKALMEHDDENLWLSVLKNGWTTYQQFFPRIKNLLKGQQVRTISGEVKPVSETWIPLPHFVNEFGKHVPFIDLSDINDQAWPAILEPLAVEMIDNIRFYTRCLESVRQDASVSDAKICRILRNLEDKAEHETEASGISAMRSSFEKNELVFIPASKSGGNRLWVSPFECFWRGEPWLTQSVGLAAVHPDLETLFRTHIKISDSTDRHIIKEAEALEYFPQPVPYDRVVRIVLALNKLAKKGEELPIDQIKKLAIFPIVTTPQDEPYESLTSVDSKKPWLIADRAHLRQHFRDVVPVLAFKPEFIHKIRFLIQKLGLEERFLSKLASSVTEALGDVTPSKKLTMEYRERSKHFFRLIPTDQANTKQLVSSYNRIEVYTCSKVVQYWKATLGLSPVQSAHTEGVVFLEVDYAGDLRLYLREGYEDERYPCELAEQLRNFFNVPYQHLDLLTVSLSAPDERVESLFDARGISPWIEDDLVSENGEDDGEVGVYNPVQRPIPSKKSRLRTSAGTRFSSLFGHTRFTPSFFKNKSGEQLPSYNAAVDRSRQNAIGRPAEPRTFTMAQSLPALKGTLRELNFAQTGAAIVGTPSKPMTLLERLRLLAHLGPDMGEAIVSDILATVLGIQYDKQRMWSAKDQRRNAVAAFNFTDTQGRFSGFLMRLDGMSGKAEGYTRLIYHLDVKTSSHDSFKMTQEELNRARENSVHSQPDPEDAAPSKHVSVLVLISDIRTEPKIRFLADPWDLFEDGQLILQNPRTYDARLNLRLRQAAKKPAAGEVGFDAVQFKKPDNVVLKDEPAPDYEEDNKKAMKRPAARRANGTAPGGEKTVAGPSSARGPSGVPR